MKLTDFSAQIASGLVVPYLGLEIFKGANDLAGKPLPASSDEIILALNDGRAMAPRLMMEYPRAAMSIEQRKGRKTLEALFERIYAAGFDPLPVHRRIAAINPKIVVDTNRDDALQRLMQGVYVLVYGTARVAGDLPRFEAQICEGLEGRPLSPQAITLEKPLLFKPMGVLKPAPSLILSDADYVDWLTEAMAGLAVPACLKEKRGELKWLLLGCRLERDTDRMVASEILGGEACAGGWWVTDKTPIAAEVKFAKRHKLEIIPSDLAAFCGL